MSLPMWERGLKPTIKKTTMKKFMSLPMWERGLKRPLTTYLSPLYNVAPHVGAWIETI